LAELEEEAETAEFEFNSALIDLFNRVYYPARLPKTNSEGLAYAALKLVEPRSKDGGPATVDGEAAIEEALSAICQNPRRQRRSRKVASASRFPLRG
jgi:hypothetical protein